MTRRGWTGMFQGLWPTLAGIVPYTALQFAFYEGIRGFAQVSRKCGVFEDLDTRDVLQHRFNYDHKRSTVTDSSIRFGAGFASGIMGKVATMPLDVVKKFYQVNNYEWAAAGSNQAHHVKYRGIFHCAQHIVQRYGYRGLYRGSAASILKAGPNSAVSFLVFDLCQNPFRIALGEEPL
jgi:hypothetical protein